MKKVIKFIALMIIVLIVGGYIYLMTTNSSNSGTEDLNNFKIAGSNSKVQEFVYPKENNKINITGDNFKVILKEGESDTIKLTTSVGRGKNIFVVDNSNNNINISRSLDFDVFSIFDFNFYDDSLLIEVPKDMKLNLGGDISNGRVEVKGVNFEELNFETSNSKIILNDVNVDSNLTLITKNASIEGDNLSSKVIDLKTSNGKIKVKDIKGSEITIKTSNSEVDCKNIFVNEVEIKTSNGDINLDNGDSKFEINKLITDTSNGDKNIKAYVKKQGRD